MGNRPLYWLTLVLFVTATCAGIAAQRYSARAATSAARAMAAEHDDARSMLLSESRYSARVHDRIAAATLVAFLVGIVSWIGSRRRREPGPQGVALVLAISAGVVQLLLV